MSEDINLETHQTAVYKELQKLVKDYKGPVEFGLVIADHVINIYTDRNYGMRFITHGAFRTWADEYSNYPDQSPEGYAKFIFDIILSNSLRHGKKIDLPSRKLIIKSKQMAQLREMQPHLDDNLLAKYVIYLHITGQTCKSCKIGYTKVEVGSYAEVHKCLNCGSSTMVN
jgi:hypothetical protein